MTYRPTASLAALFVFALLGGNAAHAQSINSVNRTFKLNVPVQINRPIDAVLHASAAQFQSAQFYIHHRTRREAYRRTSSRSTSHALLSRSGSFGVGSPSVVGRLGTVLADNTMIVAGRERQGRVLSVVSKGQNLAITGQTATQYAVMMIDRSTGFVPKSAVQLLDLQVLNSGAAPDPSSPVNSTASAPTGDAGPIGLRLVRSAYNYLGVPYLFGGETRDGIDCSAFVRAVYSENGISLPRVSRDQVNVGYEVPKTDVSQWVAGDRMYFACHHPDIDHTGMYIGDGYFIHASAGHDHSVAIDRVDNEDYYSHLVAVRRSQELLGDVPTTPNLVASNQGTTVASSPTITTITGSTVTHTPIASPQQQQQQASAATPAPGTIVITTDPEAGQQ